MNAAIQEWMGDSKKIDYSILALSRASRPGDNFLETLEAHVSGTEDELLTFIAFMEGYVEEWRAHFDGVALLPCDDAEEKLENLIDMLEASDMELSAELESYRKIWGKSRLNSARYTQAENRTYRRLVARIEAALVKQINVQRKAGRDEAMPQALLSQLRAETQGSSGQ